MMRAMILAGLAAESESTVQDLYLYGSVRGTVAAEEDSAVALSPLTSQLAKNRQDDLRRSDWTTSAGGPHAACME